MVNISGYGVERCGRAITLTNPGLGVAHSVRLTENEASRIARACRLDAEVARATWWLFRAVAWGSSSSVVAGARQNVKRASEGWRERVRAAWLERQRAAKLRASKCSRRVNSAGRPSEDWRADVLAVDAGAEFGRSACGWFEIAFARKSR